MSIAALLQAAEFLERREREAEHGYASSMMPVQIEITRRKPKPKKSQGNRSTHNELEKNRRAHLRNCLEKLKELVPLGPESSRHTTLGLLTKAKAFIKVLEEKDRKNKEQKELLLQHQRKLTRRLNELGCFNVITHKKRKISEYSSGTSMFTNSSASETDEVDIIGYNSNQSDTDDHSSIQSLTSDGGVVISTKRRPVDEQTTI
ncbi:max dimerization protein 1 [Caerostris darwini]|uniref:Max dimerization protein 1 n=1 Tax=Caerostris darwini TaxID=1538125 RepID=A0AAV4M9A7_9ARAC|nr:max dimerization protein 1 [Caerostris darwini]